MTLVLEIIGIVLAALIGISCLLGWVNKLRGLYVPWSGAEQVLAQERQAAKESWLHRCLVAFDIAVNVILLRGQQDETISTHSWRAQQENKLWGKLMCKWLNGFQPNHGPKAASGDLQRAQSRVVVLSKLLQV